MTPTNWGSDIRTFGGRTAVSIASLRVPRQRVVEVAVSLLHSGAEVFGMSEEARCAVSGWEQPLELRRRSSVTPASVGEYLRDTRLHSLVVKGDEDGTELRIAVPFRYDSDTDPDVEVLKVTVRRSEQAGSFPADGQTVGDLPHVASAWHETVGGYGEVLSLLCDVDQVADWREFIEPRPHIEWTFGDFHSLIPGYGWEVGVGSRLLEAAPGVAREMADRTFDDATGSEVVVFRSGDDPSDDAAIRAVLPAMRRNLRPLLPGWVVAGGSSRPFRSLEGPLVPRRLGRACRVPPYRSTAIDPIDDEGLRARLFPNVTCDVPLPLAGASSWRLTPSAGADPDGLVEMVVAALSAVERGAVDGWFDGVGFVWSRPQLRAGVIEWGSEVSGANMEFRMMAGFFQMGLVMLEVPSRTGPVRLVEALQVTDA